MNLREHDILNILMQQYPNERKELAVKCLTTIFGSTATQAQINKVWEFHNEAVAVRNAFNLVNSEVEINIPFSDIEYYKKQIMECFDYNEEKANDIAEIMAEL